MSSGHPPRPRRQLLGALAIGLGASLAAFALSAMGALTPLENVATDQLLRLRGRRPPDPRIVVCGIDGDSVRRYGRWPWRRTRVAELIDRLAAAGARVIAADMVFSEPSYPELPHDDPALAAAIGRAGDVVLGYFFRSRGTAPELLKAAFDVTGSASGGFPAVARWSAADVNLPELAAAADAQGFVNHEREGGVFRHYPLLARYRGGYHPALALRAVERFLRREPARSAGSEDIGLELQPKQGVLPRILLAGRPVGAAEDGTLWVDYRGPAKTYPHVSAARVLSGEAGAAELGGRLVFLGLTETGVGELQATPFGDEYGVEVHANVADNLLHGRYLHDSMVQHGLSHAALFLLGPLVAWLIVAVERHLHGSLWAVLLVAAWPALAYASLRGPGWHLEAMAPLLAGGAALVGAFAYRVLVVEATARRIERTFKHYVSAAVVEEMLRDPEQVKLGGERRDMTVLFSDIRGFTTLSETRDPDQVVRLLNEFFTPMTRLVLAQGGTLDKYMGDAIMAFFGAPLAQPDHAARACRAALAMRAELAALNERWRARGELAPGAGLGIGIGLNSGEMSVGNVGSESVFGYTVIGDNVNLGSRIEGLNKLYGTEVIVSAATALAAGTAGTTGEGFVFRELDAVRVKGKHEPVAIYELVGERGQVAAAKLDGVECFAAALAAYRGRDFESAETLLADPRFSDDGPVRILLARCRRLLASPPPVEWEAVENLTSK
ncbi:MAG TPA: adenylate/guanylate cyclase domain-containing protein [Thermoanaerobaculia bacterium]|jgi:adenylate cyclase